MRISFAANCPTTDWEPSSPLADVETQGVKTDIAEYKDCKPEPSPSVLEWKTVINVVPMLDDSPQSTAGQKRRQDSESTIAPLTSKKHQGHNRSRSRSRHHANKLAKTNVHGSDTTADTGVTHTNQIIRDLLEKKGYQIIADHQADRLTDLEEETSNVADALASGASMSAGHRLPTDEEAMRYFANITSAFNKGSVSELRSAIEHMLAPNAVFRSHVICLPGSTNPNFTDGVIPGKGSIACIQCGYGSVLLNAGAGVFPLYKGIMDSFPDSYWKIECCKVIANDDNTFKTVAGYFTFKGTNIDSVADVVNTARSSVCVYSDYAHRRIQRHDRD
jgi:hypothetical protein